MKKILFVLLALLMIPVASGAQEKKQFDYYYADWCPHCKKVNAFFEENGIYEKYDVKKYNFDEPQNKARLMNIFKQQKNVGQAGIPAIVIDGKLIAGDVPIIDYFDGEIGEKKSTFDEMRDFFRSVFVGASDSEKPKSGANGVTMFALVAAALVDAINPCAFAVLILLIATVVNAKGKRQALYAGLMFSLSIFVSYFLMGIGLYKAITLFDVSIYFSIGVGIFAILIGLANLKDTFWYGKWFIMEVPLSWRPKMQTILRHVTSPFGALTAGLLVSLFLLPCSSGPYVVILGMLAERVDMAKTVSLLALYNFIFITPMLLITFGMYFFNAKLSKLEKMRKENLKVLHAIAGVVMLLLGIYLVMSKL